ncbi:sigma 54-interacting transcriptional regulator [Myxococcota bacterium]|nr:sigma 54-interacting transcriptional regulator [Myxococcota bacterium]
MAHPDETANDLTQTLPRRTAAGVAAPPAPARLVVLHPPALAGARPLPIPGTLAVGRASLSEPTISRQHAELTWDAAAGSHTVRDAGSRNGTALDGRPVGETPRPLSDQAVLRFGDVVAVYERGRAVADAEAGAHPDVDPDAIPGQSAAAAALRRQVARAAPDPSPCLLLGETGTGKESVVAELHRLSGRPGALVALNCAALSPQLVESQLFGHARGAFTGAVGPQTGLFRAAERGTLFLDEIGELPLELQPKLLRAIQERQIQPVGETRAVAVDVRVVAATHRDLPDMVERVQFRRDLYARLALWEIPVPALAERRADLVAWLHRLEARWRTERPRVQTQPLAPDADVVEALLLAAWPENLRGLDRVLHRLAADGGGPVTRARLDSLGLALVPASGKAASVESAGDAAPSGGESARPGIPDAETLAALFAECGGSVRAVARRLGRDRRQIYRWVERYGLRVAAEGESDGESETDAER